MVPCFRFHSRLDLACTPSTPADARRHTRAVLEGWGLADDIAQDALTVVSELTTNAVRHANTPVERNPAHRTPPAACACAMALWIAGDRLYVAVRDQNNGRPRLRPVSPNAETGRGLQLIEGLTDGAWGFERVEPVGKVVWAGLRIAGLAHRADGRESVLSATEPAAVAVLRTAFGPAATHA